MSKATIKNTKIPEVEGKYRVSSSITINAPQAAVWQLLEDFGNVYQWAPGVEKSHSLGNKEKCIGAGRYCKLDGFGEIEEYVTHWQEGNGFIYDVTPLGPLHQAFSRWALTSTGEKTTILSVTLAYNIRFSLLGKFMHRMIMRSKLEKSLPQVLAAVKEQVEKIKSTSVTSAAA